jgi:hypothetical protein
LFDILSDIESSIVAGRMPETLSAADATIGQARLAN